MQAKARKSKSPSKSSIYKQEAGGSKKLYYILITVFTFIIYFNTISNDYSLDDNLVIQGNEQVMQGFSAIPEIFTSHYRESDRNEYGYRPLAKATFAIESEFFKQNPHVSHFINILLYIILLLLLFRLLNVIFPEVSRALNFVIILLFAAHPLHTEVVANLKNREELLCFIFAAAAVLFIMKAYSSKKYKVLYASVGIVSIVFSVLSKQTGIIFCVIIPLMLLQFHYKPMDFFKDLNPDKRRKLLKYLFLFISSVILGWLCWYLRVFPRITSVLFFIIVPSIIIVQYIRKSGSIKIMNEQTFKKLTPYIYLALFSVVIIIFGFFLYKAPEMLLPAEDKILNGFENPLFLDNSFSNRLSLGFTGLLYYLKLVFIPYPLGFYYGYDMLPLTGIADIKVLFSILVHAALFVIAVLLFYKNRIISFGIMFYLLGLAMFANLYLPIPGIIGERLLFVSSFGFCIVLGGGIMLLLNKMAKKGKLKAHTVPKLLYIITGLIILIYSVQTIARNKDWKDHLSLYSADIEHLDKSAKAHSLYGDELMRQVYEKIEKNQKPDKSKIETALKHYVRAVEIFPDYPSAYNNIGTIYFMFYRDYSSALVYFKKAEKADSLSSETVYNLAYTYEMTGDTAKALIYYEKAVVRDSASIDMISRWANLVNKTGDLEKAIEINMRIVKIDAASDRPYINIGNYYGEKKDTATAVSYWEKAIEVAPKNDPLNNFLASYFEKRGNKEKQLFYLQKISQK